MAEQVNIASLTIDVDDVIKESAKLKKQIDSLKKSQKELDTTTEEGTEAFAENDVQIRKLSKAYRDNQQFATALDKANEDLTKTMQVEGKSTQQLRDDRAALNQISKNIIGDTEEEIALRDQLNGVIDEQTEALKKQAPGYIEQKENIGAYTDGINAADFNLKEFIVRSKEVGGVGNLVKSGLKAATTGMISFTKAAAAFILTPVGAVLAIIAGAFLLIKNAMDRSEESTSKIKRAFSGFTGIIKFFGKALEPIGTFLIDVFAKGLEKIADLFGKLNPELAETIEKSRELADAELALEKAQRQARITQLEYQKGAEELRQIRDDETKSFAERITANEQLGALLDEQLQKEKELAQEALNVANLRIQLDGETSEALDAQADALTEIADIEERITGQTSEQLVNRVQLQRELAALQEEERIAEQERLVRLQQQANAERNILIDSKEAQIEVEKAGNDKIVLETEKLQQRILDVKKKAADEEKKLNQATADSSTSIAEDTAGNVQELIGENTRAGKAAGIATTLINTYLGAQAAFAQTPGGIFVKLLAASTAVAAGLRNVAKIRATNTEFARGDILQGRSHANGGIPFSIGGRLGFEAEGGEALINKRSTAMFTPLLSAINVAGGGKKFASGDILGGSGVPSSSIVNYDLLASKVAEAYSSLPAPVVAVSEIQEVANGVEVVESLATS